MKFLTISFLCILTTSNLSINAQQLNTSSIPFPDIKVPNKYIELLKLKDPNSLIIETITSGSWNTPRSNLIVFMNNGKVLKYVRNKTQNKTDDFIPIKVNKKSYAIYWQFLEESIKMDRFNIRKDSLDITIKTNADGTMGDRWSRDGMFYNIYIVHGEKEIHYKNYDPESYIEFKANGYKERIKLLTLINDFNTIFRKN